jgi:hypothetical protein
MLILGSYSLGHHGFFFREGDAITIPAANTGSIAGPASRTNKPDPTDPLYQDIGAIADWSDETKSLGDEKIYKPSPGRMQHYDSVEKGAEFTKKFTAQEIQALAMEIFYRTKQKLTSAGGVFNPLSAAPRRGWFHTELYDQNDTFVFNLDLYGLLRITGGMGSKEGSVVKPNYELTVLYSTLNVGLLATT